MRLNRRTVVIVCLIACAGVAAAWQSALSAVGWSEEAAMQIAESFFANSSMKLPAGGSMSAQTKARWIGKTPAERAAAIRELALYTKGRLQTPAFEKIYSGWIKSHYNAVNHGIKVDPNAAAGQEDISSAMNEAAAAMVQAFSQLPTDQLRMLLNNDIESVKNSARASDKQMLARYRRIEDLLKTNPAEAKKQYALAKSAQMGGGSEPDMAKAAQSAADRKRREEQLAWDQHNLKAELRRRLSEFVKTAESVDFAAQTQRNAGKMVFVNPAYERKPSDWKVLYRLGKEPTLAAVEVARQWLKEL